MKIVRVICSFFLLLVSLLAVYSPGAVLAQEEPEETIEMSSTYPTLEAIAGENFEFELEFRYIGPKSRVFDLRPTAPQGWEVFITPPYEKEKKVSSVTIEPAFSFGNKLRVVASAPFTPLPDPGEYKIGLEVVSGELKNSIEFTAVITARYFLVLVSSTDRLNTTATSGKDNFFSTEVGNLGTAVIDDINFSSEKPEGWTIEFSPDKIDTLETISAQTIDINIKPPPETIAGDYSISITASGKQISSQKLNIRVTVETPTIWGWVGVGIILIVVVGLVFIFMRFSRR